MYLHSVLPNLTTSEGVALFGSIYSALFEIDRFLITFREGVYRIYIFFIIVGVSLFSRTDLAYVNRGRVGRTNCTEIRSTISPR